jgi:hypothetical protein
MGEQTMKKNGKSHIWWWLLLLVVLALVGYYLYSELWPKPEEVEVSPVKEEGLSEIQPEAAAEVRKPIPSLPEEVYPRKSPL